jgi:hypothetical protein
VPETCSNNWRKIIRSSPGRGPGWQAFCHWQKFLVPRSNIAEFGLFPTASQEFFDDPNTVRRGEESFVSLARFETFVM